MYTKYQFYPTNILNFFIFLHSEHGVNLSESENWQVSLYLWVSLSLCLWVSLSLWARLRLVFESQRISVPFRWVRGRPCFGKGRTGRPLCASASHSSYSGPFPPTKSKTLYSEGKKQVTKHNRLFSSILQSLV